MDEDEEDDDERKVVLLTSNISLLLFSLLLFSYPSNPDDMSVFPIDLNATDFSTSISVIYFYN